MSELIFAAFILVYGLLAIGHKNDGRTYKIFLFGFLVSVLYASVYSLLPGAFPIFMVVFTTLAILTQYFHIRAVHAGRAKPTKIIADVSRHHDLEKIKAHEAAKAVRRR
jgi:hypothetical protein